MAKGPKHKPSHKNNGFPTTIFQGRTVSCQGIIFLQIAAPKGKGNIFQAIEFSELLVLVSAKEIHEFWFFCLLDRGGRKQWEREQDSFPIDGLWWVDKKKTHPIFFLLDIWKEFCVHVEKGKTKKHFSGLRTKLA